MKKIIIWVVCISFIFVFQSLIYAEDWNQDAGNAQRTGYTSEEPVLPWSFVWNFNGSDSSGGISTHSYDAPHEARTITGGGKVFIPAGSKGLYGINIQTGSQDWNISTTSFMGTPVYDPVTLSVFAGGTDGKIYKIKASDGSITSTYLTGSQIRKSMLLVGSYIYAVTDGGQLYKVSTSSMQNVWTYNANAVIDTPPSYSVSRDSIIFGTADLNIHAVNNNNGSLKWKKKPTPVTSGGKSRVLLSGTHPGNQFDRGWPVIAEKHGVVFLRMQLDHQAHYEGLNSGKFAGTNAENRTWLQSNPQWRDMFALNLDDGSEKFIPVSGYGSTEDYDGTSSVGVMGPQPVVKLFPDGTEVVYMYFRNLQGNSSDYRWSGHLGEMVLDSTTVPGMVAGDFRFIQADQTSAHIIDEQNPLTMAGTSLFQNHWSSSVGLKITNRSTSIGLNQTSPITTSLLPPIMRAMKACGSFSNSHYSTCSGVQYTTGDGDQMNGRGYPGPAFYNYWNVLDPPGWRVGSYTAGTSYSTGFQPRYLYVSNGYIVVEGNAGEIFVLKHSGTVTNPTLSVNSPTPVISSRTGDANGDNKIDGADFVIWLNHYGQNVTGAVVGDYNNSGRVDGADFVLWLNNYTF